MPEIQFAGLSAQPPDNIISKFVTKNRNLIIRSKMVVISGDESKFNMRIYRESTSTPGSYSCDNYNFEQFKRVGKVIKDRKKYSKPSISSKAIQYKVGNTKIYSMFKLNKDQIKSLNKLI